MSHSSIEDDQKKAEITSRMWAESEPGPSRHQLGRQGYCGYCRVLYNNLDQHLSSLRHLDSVQSSSRGSTSVSSTCSNQTRLTLLERFLQDVLQHHPHRYNDPRPSHADLPSVSTPPMPRAELDDLCLSDDDSRSLGTREHLPSSDDGSCQPANQEEDFSILSQSADRTGLQKFSSPIRELNDEGTVPAGRTCSPHPGTPPPHSKILTPYPEAPPSVHRKAYRKTNRRKPSESSSSHVPSGPVLKPHHKQGPNTSKKARSPTEPWAQFPTEPKPWLSWQRERREAFSDQSDLLDQTIEEVIQMCCHSASSARHQQEETESLHLSLPASIETQSEDWDSPVQVFFQRAGTMSDAPVQVTQTEGWDVSRLMDIQVDIEDDVYFKQLDSALLGGGVKQDEGFWTLPVEEILPIPEHIPESFRGKTWTQIEQEDEEKVERLVQQFRRGRFICYFDTEYLARYGGRSQQKTGLIENKEEEEPETDVLPSVDRNNEDFACGRRRKRRSFRLASRCQVVKVSHSTQTVRLVVPAVHLFPEAPPISIPAAIQRTPEMQTWHRLPPSYSNIVTPVQSCTSIVYLLCSPSDSAPIALESTLPKRCRRRRRHPVDLQRLKVKYKKLPVLFYEPGTNRILKKPPKRLRRYRSSASLGPMPPCVRQLFRSLSPDLNTDQHRGEGPKADSRDSAQTDRRRGRTSQAPPTSLQSRSKQERGGRPRPPPSNRRSRVQAPPLQPRRDGLRRAALVKKHLGSAHLPPRRRRGQRGRGSEKGAR
ncbi:DBF4-type zinc finger-containing protein 2 isoform X2 [Kryptolebias marmoratus]|nr:DBF4-type zinc finger-containing protein 2 isoform X2 [Kryptolebias marmoratus]XP_037830303.1 DBF4-type zinc finger-containing protein 2 isoform X2 [Kryptolebias marmoratus]